MKNTKKAVGYYKPEIIEKFTSALKTAIEDVKSGKVSFVSISNSNSKMGAVASVSTLPFLTCPARCQNSCGVSCYAAKLANLRKNVLVSYARNTALAMLKPDAYFKQIDAAASAVKYFRFHVSGDIMSADYFARMIQIVRGNPSTEFLAFTKRYEIVNSWIDANGPLPANFHVLFSGWENLETINPHALPETNVFETEDQTRDNWKLCGGNCFDCACRGVGCGQAQTGDVIAFKKH